MSSRALLWADMFVLMTITQSVSRPGGGALYLSRRPCRGRIGLGATRPLPHRLLEAAGRLISDAPYIGRTFAGLNGFWTH